MYYLQLQNQTDKLSLDKVESYRQEEISQCLVKLLISRIKTLKNIVAHKDGFYNWKYLNEHFWSVTRKDSQFYNWMLELSINS